MTTRECEDKLLALAEQAKAIYSEYNPDGDYLTIALYQGRISITDRLKCEDGEYASMCSDFDKACSLYVFQSKDDTSRTEFWRRIYKDIAHTQRATEATEATA